MKYSCGSTVIANENKNGWYQGILLDEFYFIILGCKPLSKHIEFIDLDSFEASESLLDSAGLTDKKSWSKLITLMLIDHIEGRPNCTRE